MLSETMQNEKNKLLIHLKNIDNQLSLLPEGNLICSHNREKPKFYLSNKNKKTYLRKSQDTLITQYFAKRYLSLLKKEILQELEAINSYLHLINTKNSDSTDFLQKYPEFATKISTSYLLPHNNPQIDINTWLNIAYEANPFHPEGLIHKGYSGKHLRSKSECLIDMCLHINGIPFKYECPIHIDNKTYYPDFTVLNPKNGKIMYWEHLGLLDNPEYFDKAINKIKTYSQNGIYPGINLIITSETSDSPLDVNYIETLINYYFL